MFETLEDAIAQITAHAEHFDFPMQQGLNTPELVIAHSVRSNVFRALGVPNHQSRPSVVYQEWAQINFDHLNQDIAGCANEGEYTLAMSNYSLSLADYWYNNTGHKIGFGPASKIVNLLVKAKQESPVFQTPNVVLFQHIPWDSYTLKPLRFIINDLTGLPFLIKIPREPSMSFVATPQMYDWLQTALSTLYAQLPVHVPKIHYDYFAWNENH